MSACGPGAAIAAGSTSGSSAAACALTAANQHLRDARRSTLARAWPSAGSGRGCRARRRTPRPGLALAAVANWIHATYSGFCAFRRASRHAAPLTTSAATSAAPTSHRPHIAQLGPALHAQPGGLWHMSCRLMQLLPQALPLLQTRQQLCGSLAGCSGDGGLGSSRFGLSRVGLVGARCCAIASPAGAQTSIANAKNPVLTPIGPRYHAARGSRGAVRGEASPHEPAQAARLDMTRLIARDCDRCALCLESLDRKLGDGHPRAVTLDHVDPVSRGGAAEFANLRRRAPGSDARRCRRRACCRRWLGRRVSATRADRTDVGKRRFAPRPQ